METDSQVNANWLPYPEHKPENLSFVLATLKSKECKWVEIVGYNEGKFLLMGRGLTNIVTHWMQVPEPANS